jgi:hypothetical protein
MGGQATMSLLDVAQANVQHGLVSNWADKPRAPGRDQGDKQDQGDAQADKTRIKHGSRIYWEEDHEITV